MRQDRRYGAARLGPALVFGLCVFSATCLVADGPPAVKRIETNAPEIGCYEKLELRVSLDATFSNPYDPNQIDLWAEFTAPSGKEWTIWGFYNPTSINSRWMVRFAPTETGQWQYVVKVTDSGGTAESAPGSFTVVKSAQHGFVQVASNNRYLCHSDGTSFYGVGLWYNDGPTPVIRARVETRELDNLKRRGANFICTRLEPLETLGTGLGRYDQAACLRIDQLLESCEERDIHIGLNLWFHNYLSKTIWDSYWSKVNPYRFVTEMKDFYGSEEAWSYQEKLYRYIIARWGYSRAVFLWFVMDEINGTDGWYHDRPAAERWCQHVHDYFKQHDPYGRPTTGTQSGGIREWWPEGYEIFDIAAREIYEAQGHPIPKSGKLGPDDPNPLRLSYQNYQTQTERLVSGFAKPAIIGECGWDHTYYEPGMPGYLAMYHNAIWVGLANGLCATPFWWSFTDWTNDSVVTNQMLYFGNFVGDIDFANLDLKPAKIVSDNCDAWAMRDDRFAFGWLVNPTMSVAKESFTVSGLPDGEYAVRLYRTWRGAYLPDESIQCRNGNLTVTIPELVTRRGHAAYIGNDVAFKIIGK